MPKLGLFDIALYLHAAHCLLACCDPIVVKKNWSSVLEAALDESHALARCLSATC